MISIINSVQVDDDQQRIEGVCLSTDSKPTTGISNGSMLIEMNTGKIFAYNESGTAWVELA